MNHKVKIIFLLAASAINACSTQPPQSTPPGATVEPKPEVKQTPQPENYDALHNPPLTITKAGKTLNLVRVMDGGICKNERQGASGSFLVYADPQDIDRIKREKSTAIFKDFETRIQNISSEILEQAIIQTNLGVDPFSLGEDVMQEKLAKKLMESFRTASRKPIADFTHETTLTIDILPFEPSLIFYQKGCDIDKINP